MASSGFGGPTKFGGLGCIACWLNVCDVGPLGSCRVCDLRIHFSLQLFVFKKKRGKLWETVHRILIELRSKDSELKGKSVEASIPGGRAICRVVVLGEKKDHRVAQLDYEIQFASTVVC